LKTLVVLLLLANIGYFGWQYNEHVREQTSRARSISPLPSTTPRLKLIDELEELPPLRVQSDVVPRADRERSSAAQDVDITTEVLTNGDASGVCINAGPFPTGSKLSDFQTWLRSRAATIHTATETVRKRELFWVYLEADSESAAQQNLADLKSKGVKDYLLIRRGGLKNAISLGLFSSQDSVNRRLAEMNRQGYKPVVVPRFETTNRHWVRANLVKGHEDITEAPAELLGTAQLLQISCSKIADPISSS